MDITTLFKDLHGAIAKKDLQKYKDVNPENAELLAGHLGIPVDTLHFNPEGQVHPISYWEGPVYNHFFGNPVTIEQLEFMGEVSRFHQVKKGFNEMYEKKNFHALFAYLDKKVVIDMYNQLYAEIPDADKYDIFTDIYQRSEFNFHLFDEAVVADVFTKRELSKDWEKRMKHFRKVTNYKERVRVYRGEGDPTGEFYSWTRSKKTAEFFANRFNAGGKVLVEVISVDRVLDYLVSRGEQEVLVRPE